MQIKYVIYHKYNKEMGEMSLKNLFHVTVYQEILK